MEPSAPNSVNLNAATSARINSVLAVDTIDVYAPKLTIVSQRPVLASNRSISLSSTPDLSDSPTEAVIVAVPDRDLGRLSPALRRFDGLDLRDVDLSLSSSDRSGLPDVRGGFVEVLEFLNTQQLPVLDITFASEPLSVAEAIAGATPTQAPPEPDRPPAVEEALRRELDRMGINVRPLSVTQRRQRATDAIVIDDLPAVGRRPEARDFIVTDARITREAAGAAVASFRRAEERQATESISRPIAAGFDLFREAVRADPSVAGGIGVTREEAAAELPRVLRQTVQAGDTDAAAAREALVALAELREVLDRVSGIGGFSPAEANAFRESVLRGLQIDGATPAEVRAAVEALDDLSVSADAAGTVG